MNVLHFSTNGRQGGAGQAAWRLHEDLARSGVHSRMLTLSAADSAPGLLHVVLPASGGDERARFFRELFISSNRTPLSNTWFGAEIEGYDLTQHPAVREADVLHLHWISGMLSASHIAQLLATGKPVVWTMHDLAAVTGGCHYPAGCTGYRHACASCPQLMALADSLPAAQLADKRQLWREGRLGIIALNSWMADIARHAPALAGRPVSVIPNGIDLDQFHPRRRQAQRQLLKLAPYAVVFLFVADAYGETRKGAAILAEAIKLMGNSPEIRKATDEGRLVFLSAGQGQFPETGLPVRSLGWCDTDQLASYYAAADAFLLPSLEDNLPNTVVESLAAGTPTIGFAVGGVPEMITDGQTGRLVKAGDAAALAQALTTAFETPASLAVMRPHCRVAAEKNYDGKKNAMLVGEFYRQLCARPPHPPRQTPVFPGTNLAVFLNTPRPETLGRAPGQLLTQSQSVPSEVEVEYDARLKELGALYETADALRNERNLLQAQLADLQKNFVIAEKDRLERGEIVKAQGRKHTQLEGEFDSRLKELKQLYTSAESLKNERNLLQAQLADLQKNFAAIEQDRNERGRLIEAQGKKFSKFEGEFDSRLKELKQLYTSAESLKNERNLLQAQLADLQKNFAAVEQDRNERGRLIEAQGKKFSKFEGEFDSRLKELKQLYTSAESLKNERNLLQAQLADLQKNFTSAEADRLQRGEVIKQQGIKLSALEGELDARLKELKVLYASAESFKNERNLLQAQLADLQKNFTATEQDRNERGKVIELQGHRVSELERLVWLTEQDRDRWKNATQPPST